ncbi:heavy metal translocating P-type ATPase [Methanovulcanius yangii]|uniref:heavy metal translocating P-type ATPase n=1 Tax=Methanovulcanius yangii TaxID=1789227 RepID=UPI0029CA51DB|nr:heavy metal translocating P-type ATPase [Methanovulcanius yangii]
MQSNPSTKQATLKVTGMHCATCVATVEKALLALDGVREAAVNLNTEKATATFDPDLVTVQTMEEAVISAGYGVIRQTVSIRLGGIHCASCVQTVEKALMSLDGVSSAQVNLTTNRAIVAYDPDRVPLAKMKSVIEQAGYQYLGFEGDAGEKQEEEMREADIRNLRNRTLIGFAVSLPLMAIMLLGIPLPIPMPYFMFLVSTPFFLYLAYPIFRAGWGALRNRTLNMDVMYSMGIGVAYASSVLGTFEIVLTQDFLFYETAVMLAAFLTLGRFLEARAKGRTTDAIKHLIELQAKTATVIRDGAETEVAIEDLNIGDRIVVKPGGKVPVDGTIIAGESFIDESMISGEPVPVHKTTGDTVIGSTINTSGAFTFEAKKIGKDTYLAQIIRMVESAQGTKPPIQKYADRAVTWFIPAILVIAISAFLVWYLLLDATLLFALTVLISILVVACPCALGLATPTAITVGVGRGADFGILIKNSEILELSEKVTRVIFDKTGTLTKGEPKVASVASYGMNEEDVLSYAAGIETYSEHPLARAVLEEAEERHINPVETTGFSATGGRGVEAHAGKTEILLGNRPFIEGRGIGILAIVDEELNRNEKAGATAIILVVDGAVAGVIGVADTIKETSGTAVSELTAMNIRVGMITGDNARTAGAVAAAIGIDQVIAEVLPEQKSAEIARLQEGEEKIVFVGDGINDAPALAQSDVGIAIGSGTDVAIESGDIVLVKSDPLDVAAALQLGRKVMGKIRMNLFWAFAYNTALVPVAAGVLYPLYGITFRPEFAGLAMALSSVTVVSLSLLLKRYVPPAIRRRTSTPGEESLRE